MWPIYPRFIICKANWYTFNWRRKGEKKKKHPTTVYVIRCHWQFHNRSVCRQKCHHVIWTAKTSWTECVCGSGVGVGVYVSVYSHGPWLYSSTVDGMIYELEYTERKTHTHTPEPRPMTYPGQLTDRDARLDSKWIGNGGGHIQGMQKGR